MNIFHHYMQGAAQECVDTNVDFIDETLSMVIDDGMRFMIDYPHADNSLAFNAGILRIRKPTEYAGFFPPTL